VQGELQPAAELFEAVLGDERSRKAAAADAAAFADERPRERPRVTAVFKTGTQNAYCRNFVEALFRIRTGDPLRTIQLWSGKRGQVRVTATTKAPETEGFA
jgi:hypothetical protein